MDTADKRLTHLGEQIKIRKIQVAEIREMYDIAKGRLVRIEKQLAQLETMINSKALNYRVAPCNNYTLP